MIGTGCLPTVGQTVEEATFEWETCAATALIDGVMKKTTAFQPKIETPKSLQDLNKSKVLAVFDGFFAHLSSP